MKAIAVKNSYNAKESLKLAGFTFDPESKTWSKDFESKEAFDAWYNDQFTSAAHAGRKQSRFNSEVVFEFAENKEEVTAICEKQPQKIEIPTEEEAIAMVENGEIHDLTVYLGDNKAYLNGYYFTAVGQSGPVSDFREIRKVSEEAKQQVDQAVLLAAKAYISHIICIKYNK